MRNQPRYVFSYVRGSDDTPANGLEAQQATIAARAADFLKDGFLDGGEYADGPNVSGSTRLLVRPAGRRLSLETERGDVVLVAKMDRAFPSIDDMANTFRVLRSRGVSVVAIDLERQGIEAIAAFQRSRASERIKAGFAAKRRAGQIGRGGLPPYGYQIRRKTHRDSTKERWFAPCPRERKIGAKIVELADKGFSWDGVYFELLRRGVKNKRGKECSRSWIQSAYHAEKRLRAWEASQDLKVGSGTLQVAEAQ